MTALHIATFDQLVIVTDPRGRFFAVALFPKDCGGTIAIAGSRFQWRGHRFVAPSEAPTRMLAGVEIDERRLLEASGVDPAAVARFEERRQKQWATKRRAPSRTPDALKARRRRELARKRSLASERTSNQADQA